MADLTRVATIGLSRFLLLHEPEIAEAHEKSKKDDWELLYHTFWQIWKRQPGKGKR